MVLLLAWGCGGMDSPGLDGGRQDASDPDGGPADAAVQLDASDPDGGPADAAMRLDASDPDGSPMDATTPPDAGPECTIDADCDDLDPCTLDTCSMGTCTYTDAPEGTECSAGACDGAGRCVGCTRDDDCADPTPYCDTSTNTCVACRTSRDCNDRNPCTTDLCTAAGTCSFRNVTPGTSCPGGACDDTGACVECVDDGDCSAPTPYCDTSTNTCVACRTSRDCNDGNPCTIDTCSMNTCSTSFVPAGSGSCTLPSPLDLPGVCDGAGGCVQCITDAHCSEPTPRCGDFNRCVECLSSAECPRTRPVCERGACTIGPIP